MTPLLDVRDLRVRYGPVAAVDGVTMAVETGSIVGLIGPNGAGKTTFIDALTGFTPVSGGTVRFADQPIEQRPAHVRARLGLTRTFQSLELFEDLTVRENLMVGVGQARWWDPLADAVRPSRIRASDAVEQALALTDLSADGDRRPTELSNGRRRTVALARALASRPRLVLLDEPGAGLDPAETAELGALIGRLPEQGTTVLLIDHDMSLVMSACEVVWVLEFGQIIANGPPATVRHDPRVIAAYLGASVPAHPETPGEGPR